MTTTPKSFDHANKVVVAYLDGHREKGYIFNFSAVKASFTLFRKGGGPEDKGVETQVEDLKAIFFVRDFDGNPSYKEPPVLERPAHGRRVDVTFRDGEKLTGATDAYNPQKLGFFMFPPDKQNNNVRIFVVTQNATQVKLG